ncbi:alpha/beta fold hydrolase [Bacteriovorax sp. Seq25_V]|uniref:alpha/beta fold hydrolase n=1 Tax=Bacteriovorax sp. Seq25_V TaxID=1201288 RepID=UPI000696B7EF|nr:alpha/beta fold hydrolase [Bacteriovorax sp. Seq25_V]
MLLLVFTLSAKANICLDVKVPDSEFYTFQNDIKIKTHDGFVLSANLLVPKVNAKEKNGNKFPTIIFGNSWLLDEHEYLRQATRLAKEGYQVLSYSLRGWGCSEGEIDIIGPSDTSDFKLVVDWLRDHTSVDMKRIGLSGISYGGGLSLMMAAKEPRIKTVVAMSAWGSLLDALYANETPRKFWGDFLIISGKYLGNAPQYVKEYFDKLSETSDEKEIAHIIKWAKERSPVEFIDEVNKRKVPVMIANNFGDNLFTPNNVLSYFKKLKGPKKLILAQGTHATTELGGLFFEKNIHFNFAKIWFDYWLKGIDHPFIHDKDMFIESDLKKERNIVSSKRFDRFKKPLYLNERGVLGAGKLLGTYPVLKESDEYFSYFDSFAGSGIPFISDLIDGNFSVPKFEYIPRLFRRHALVFEGKRLSETLLVQGNVEVSLKVKSTDENIHLIGYLYDVGPRNIAKLITHGVVTKRSVIPFQNYILKFDLNTTSYKVDRDHSLVFVIDSSDILYNSYQSPLSKIIVEYGKETSLKVPWVRALY